MATATQTKTLLDRYGAIFGKGGFIPKHNIERNDEIELLGLSTISGVDALFLGDPGVGKTWMIEILVDHCLTEMSLFTHLLAKDQSADEVLGPRSLTALKADEIRRMTAGFLPEANYAYLDEIFKASPPMLNPLLDVLANRVLKMGGSAMDCAQLIAVFMSSNELPEREDLSAFRDRIGITKVVAPVRGQAGRRAVTDIQLDFQAGGLDTTGLEPLALSDIQKIRDEVRVISVPPAVRDMMGEAQQKWLEAGHPPSSRRVGQMWKVVKAHAWANGRAEVCADDLIPCQHMAFNQLEHADSARAVILEFAGAFTRKAERLRESLEPVLQQMDNVKTQMASAEDQQSKDDLIDTGFKLLRELRKMRTEGKKLAKDGQAQGQDISAIESVLTEVDTAYDWATNAITGTDGDEA